MNIINKDTIFRNDESCLQKVKLQCFQYTEIVFKVKNNDFKKNDIVIYQYYKYQPHALDIVVPEQYIVIQINQDQYKLILKIYPGDVYSNYTMHIQDQDIVDVYTMFDDYIPLQSNLQSYLSILKDNKILTGFQFQICKYENEVQYSGFLEIIQRGNTFLLKINNQNNRTQKEVNLKHLNVVRPSNFQMDSIELTSLRGSQKQLMHIQSNDINVLILIELLIQMLQRQVSLDQYLNLWENRDNLISNDKFLLQYNKNTMNITHVNPKLSNNLTLQHMKYHNISHLIDSFKTLNQLLTQSYVLFNDRYVIFSYQVTPLFNDINVKCITSDQKECSINQNSDKLINIQSQDVDITISKDGLIKKEQEFMFYHDQLQVKDDQNIVLLHFNNVQDFIAVINAIYCLLSPEPINNNPSCNFSSLHALSEAPSLEQQEQMRSDSMTTFKKVHSQLLEPEKSLIDYSIAESDEINISIIPQNAPKKSRLGTHSKTEGKITAKKSKWKKAKV